MVTCHTNASPVVVIWSTFIQNIRTKLQSASTVTTPLFRIVNETKKPSSKFKQHAGITGFHSTDKFIEQLRSSCLGPWYTNMNHGTAPNCSVRALCFIFIPSNDETERIQMRVTALLIKSHAFDAFGRFGRHLNRNNFT